MIVWISLIIYVFLINIIISKIKVKDKNKWFLIFAGLGVIFIMGSRSHLTGVPDINVYYNYYDYISNIAFKDIFKYNPYGFEVGYILLNKVFSLFLHNPQTILYLEAFICVSCTSYFIYKNSQKMFDSLIYFICFGCMMFALSGFRQAIAMSICLVSIEFIKKKKFIPFFILVLIACTFHQTAVIFFVSYFVINSDFKIEHISALALFFILVIGFNDKIIFIANNVFNRHYEGYTGSAFNGIMYVIIDLLIIAMAIITKKNNNNKNKIGINMTVLSLIFFVSGYFVEISQRISWYFLYGTIIALPNLYTLIENKRNQEVVRFLFLIFAILLFIYRFSNNQYSNYEFFWS